MNSATFDLGFYTQAIWTTLHGQLVGLSLEPSVATSNFAYHFEPLQLLIAPLYWLYPDPKTLLILQSVVLASGVFPASWLALRKLGSNLAALVFAATYAFFPGLQAANMYDFHPFALTAPLLLFAFYYLEERRNLPFALFAVLAMSCKENVPLTIAMFGLYTLLVQRRWRLGLVTVAGAAAWFAIAAYVIIPHYNAEGTGWIWNRYGGMAGSPLEVALYLLQNPTRLLEPAPELSNIEYLGKLLMPVAYLSLLHPLTFVLAAPGLATNVLTTYEPMHLLETYHYTSSLVPIVIISAIYGCGVLLNVTARLSSRAVAPALLAALLAVVTGSSIYHYYRGYTPLSPSFSLDLPNQHHALGASIAASLPAEASVAAQPNLGPHVAQRFEHIQFPEIRDADYIFIDVSSQPNTGGLWNGFHTVISEALANPNYGWLHAEDGFLLLERGRTPEPLPDGFYSFARAVEPQPSHRLSLRFGDELELIGFDTRVGREAAVDLTLYWRALKSIPEDYLLALFITDGQGKEEGATMHPQPANYWYPTSKWRSGEVIKVQTMLLPWAPRERDYGLALAVVRGQDPWRVEARLPITVGQATWLVGAAANGSIAELVTVDNDRGLARPVFSPRPGGWQSGSPPADSTLTGSLGEGVRLLGHQFIGEQARAGDTVKLKLWWQVDRPPAGQLTTFVHLLGPDGALAAQGDGPALGGRLPTSFWQAGDLLADEYEIKLPIDLTPGQYTAIVGMYSKEDGKRLGTIDANGVAGDALTLSGSLTVGNN